MVVLGVSGWQLLRDRHVEAFTGSARLAAGVVLVCTVLVMVTGDLQARLMDTQQPMKMAAAEAVYRTQAGASFSLLTIGNRTIELCHGRVSDSGVVRLRPVSRSAFLRDAR